MRTVLVPTDFTVGSLIAIKDTLKKNHGDSVNIILFHSLSLSDSITDLLMFSKNRFIREQSSKVFTDACEIMKNKFSNEMGSFSIEIFTGNTAGAFANFIDANNVTDICYLEDYTYAKPAKYSQNPLQFIKKAPVKITAISQKIPQIPAQETQLAILLTESV